MAHGVIRQNSALPRVTLDPKYVDGKGSLEA